MQRWTRGQIGGATSLRKRKNLYQTVDQVIVTLDKMKMSKRKWKKKGDDEKEKNLESDKQEPYWRQECDKSNEERPLVMIKELEGYFYLYIYIYIYIYISIVNILLVLSWAEVWTVSILWISNSSDSFPGWSSLFREFKKWLAWSSPSCYLDFLALWQGQGIYSVFSFSFNFILWCSQDNHLVIHFHFIKTRPSLFAGIPWFCLFHGLSTFWGYLMPNPSFLKNSSSTI